jgi:hypothetical protein
MCRMTDKEVLRLEQRDGEKQRARDADINRGDGLFDLDCRSRGRGPSGALHGGGGAAAQRERGRRNE